MGKKQTDLGMLEREILKRLDNPLGKLIFDYGAMAVNEAGDNLAEGGLVTWYGLSGDEREYFLTPKGSEYLRQKKQD